MRSEDICVLFFLDVPWAIIRIFAREFVRMRLDRVRIKYLYHFAEVDALYQIINIFVVVVVRKNDECLRYITRLGETYDEMAKVFYTIVNLKIVFTFIFNCIALAVVCK